jgi:hypothetical protein
MLKPPHPAESDDDREYVRCHRQNSADNAGFNNCHCQRDHKKCGDQAVEQVCQQLSLNLMHERHDSGRCNCHACRELLL